MLLRYWCKLCSYWSNYLKSTGSSKYYFQKFSRYPVGIYWKYLSLQIKQRNLADNFNNWKRDRRKINSYLTLYQAWMKFFKSPDRLFCRNDVTSDKVIFRSNIRQKFFKKKWKHQEFACLLKQFGAIELR